LILSRSVSMVKVIGQSSRLQEENNSSATVGNGMDDCG